MDSVLFIKALGAFFAIMNPFQTLPVFLALTDGQSPQDQRRTGMRVVFFSAIIVAVVLVAGNAILKFFGVGVDEFRVAGGIVLMTVALGMLNGAAPSHAGTADEQAQQARQDDPAFYPIAFPMEVGPGAITTLIVFAGQVHSLSEGIAVGAAIVIVMAILAVVLWFGGNIGKHMSQTLRTIMTRLMGMIVAAIAVELVVVGLTNLFPGLAH